MRAMVLQTLFGFSELSARWGVSTDTLKRLAARGHLKTVRLAGRVLVPDSEVKKIEAEGLDTRKNSAKKVKAAQ